MRIKVKFASSNKELEICMRIRKSVFIEEQKIPKKVELDDSTIKAIYFIAYMNDIPVGTARYQKTQFGVKLERFAVLKSYRNSGVGKALVSFIIKSIENKNNIYLHAQVHVINFYSRFGFQIIGEKFYEANILHWKMVYKLNTKF